MDEELNTNESPTNHCCGQNSTLKLIPNCFVEKILQRDGEAVGVVGYVDEYDETDSGPFRKPPLRRVKLVVSTFTTFISLLVEMVFDYNFALERSLQR